MREHRYRNPRISKDSRIIPIYGSSVKGDGTDADRFYKCWNCGFICDTQQDALGDANSRSGVAIFDNIESPDRYGSGNLASLATLGGSISVMENGIDSQPKAIRHSQISKSGTGCPLCHTRNWRGDD